jgi:hypothetical protein
LAAAGGAHVVYVLEFLVFDSAGKRLLDSMTHRAKSVEHAKNYAKSVMRNVIIQGQKAALCEIKDQMGNIAAVVPAEG